MKFSLNHQIEEIEREIKLREHVYPGLIAKGSMRQTVADFHLGRIKAALATLHWMREHEAEIKAAAWFGARNADCPREGCPVLKR